jgi:hypothetical protein
MLTLDELNCCWRFIGTVTDEIIKNKWGSKALGDVTEKLFRSKFKKCSAR